MRRWQDFYVGLISCEPVDLSKLFVLMIQKTSIPFNVVLSWNNMGGSSFLNVKPTLYDGNSVSFRIRSISLNANDQIEVRMYSKEGLMEIGILSDNEVLLILADESLIDSKLMFSTLPQLLFDGCSPRADGTHDDDCGIVVASIESGLWEIIKIKENTEEA